MSEYMQSAGILSIEFHHEGEQLRIQDALAALPDMQTGAKVTLLLSMK